MKKKLLISFILIFFVLGNKYLNSQTSRPIYIPWKNGKLMVSEEGRYLKHKNGTPFFWLGETGWLLPQRSDRDEAAFYLDECQKNGYNVVQVQTINAVPAINIYGEYSMIDGYDFSKIDRVGVYGYWDHMDYIIDLAEKRGIYIGMVCIWGGLVKQGKMNIEQAKQYGEFLANRYKNKPNIIWLIGGDVQGDVKTDEWITLAETIKSIDNNHIMTFHPRGRTISSAWFHGMKWLDFNMFQSGHRRYGQRKEDKNYPIEDNTEEDSWRYVETALSKTPLKPVIDGEPSYEGIPQGLHDPAEPRWGAADMRRYAYWSVFAGAFGHTYGNNSIMQMFKPGYPPAYGATEVWYDAITKNKGFAQMQYLKDLMLTFPFFERVPDQSIIVSANGERYDRIIATRGSDYLLVYNYTGKPMRIDLTKISGQKKNVWLFNPNDGKLEYRGEFDSKVEDFRYGAPSKINDRVLIAVDSSKDYIKREWSILPNPLDK